MNIRIWLNVKIYVTNIDIQDHKVKQLNSPVCVEAHFLWFQSWWSNVSQNLVEGKIILFMI